MVEVAEVFRRYGPQYREKYGARMLPSHHRVMWAIEHCQTEALIGITGIRTDPAFPLTAVWVWEDEMTWGKELPKPLKTLENSIHKAKSRTSSQSEGLSRVFSRNHSTC